MEAQEIFNKTPLQAFMPSLKLLNIEIEDTKMRLDKWISWLLMAEDSQKWFIKERIIFLRNKLTKQLNTKKYMQKRASILRKVASGEMKECDIQMDKYDIERIKKQTPIEHVMGDPVAKTQNKSWYCCPYHNEKTPSFCWNEDKHYFKCFGCGKGGDIITLYQHINNCTFPQALYGLS